MNQKGIAYLLVLILGGIIVTSSIVYYSSTIIESRVSTNSRTAQQVFYHAEGSIHKIINQIRTNTTIVPEDLLKTNTISDEFLVPRVNKPVIKPEDDHLLAKTDFNLISYTTTERHSENQTIINPDNTTRILQVFEEIVEITYNATAKGRLLRNQKEILPRTVSALVDVVFTRFRFDDPGFPGVPASPGNPGSNGTPATPYIPPGTWSGFDYGISTGGSLAFSGSTVIRNGGVFSNVNINLGNAKNQLRITGGEAYSAGTITGVGKIIPRTGKTPLNIGQTSLIFPSINMYFYPSIADRTYTGNQSFNSFADIPPTQPNVKPPDDIIVVYIDGDLRITGRFVNTQSILLVVKGSVTMTGNSEIGSPTIPFGIIAGGDINRSTGNADVNGFYYTPGKIDMKGNFYLKGAIAAAQGVSLTGNVDITYSRPLSQGLPLIISPPGGSGESGGFPGTPAIPPTPPGAAIPPIIIDPNPQYSPWSAGTVIIKSGTWKQEIK